MDSRRPAAGVLAAVVPACLLAWSAPPASGQAVDAVLRCPALDVRGAAADPDLYCIELIHAPDFPGASGTVELTPTPSPFGVAVTVDGHHRFDLAVHLAGLPDPAALGDYSGYVAWATTPRLRPIVNLGSVANGRTPVGPVDLDKFLVLVTAESDPAAAAWEGRIVLRGTSAGMRMEPEDLLALTGMVGDAAPPPPARGWRRPPMHPSVAMMPGVGRLTPPVDPFLRPRRRRFQRRARARSSASATGARSTWRRGSSGAPSTAAPSPCTASTGSIPVPSSRCRRTPRSR